MQIRRAVPRDADAIARLAADAAAEEGGASGLDGDRIKAHAFGPNALLELWVAELEKRAPLCAHAAVAKSYDVRRACPIVMLVDLFVTPAHRRSGLARQMMSVVARRARELGARELMITTGVENEVAQRFFAAIGAQRREAAVFLMLADGIDWLVAEGL